MTLYNQQQRSVYYQQGGSKFQMQGFGMCCGQLNCFTYMNSQAFHIPFCGGNQENKIFVFIVSQMLYNKLNLTQEFILVFILHCTRIKHKCVAGEKLCQGNGCNCTGLNNLPNLLSFTFPYFRQCFLYIVDATQGMVSTRNQY